jgi:hypothetical protein
MMWHPIFSDNQAPNKGEAPVLGMLKCFVASPLEKQLKIAEDPMLLEASLIIQHKSRLVELPSIVTPLHSDIFNSDSRAARGPNSIDDKK